MIAINIVGLYPVWFSCCKWQKWNKYIMDGKSFFPSENGEEIKLYSFNVKREAFLKSGLQKSGSRVLMRSKIRAMRWNVILKRSRQSLLCMHAWLSSWCSRPWIWAGLDQSITLVCKVKNRNSPGAETRILLSCVLPYSLSHICQSWYSLAFMFLPA